MSNNEIVTVLRQALEFIEETNKNSSFWMVPASRLNQTVSALRQAIAEAEKQEPVGQLLEEALGRSQVMWFKKPKDGSMIYTHPQPAPVKEWVGLTDDEINEWTLEIHPVIRAIEAKLREKNI